MREKEKNSCNVKKMVTLLVDGELSRKDREFVTRHLKECGICQKEYDALKSMDNLLLDLAPVEPSRDFSRKFWQKVDAMEQKKSQWRILQDFALYWRPALATAAGVAVIAAGSLMLYKSGLHPSGSPAPGPADMLLAGNINLYRDFDMINNLELFEHWEEIVKPEEI